MERRKRNEWAKSNLPADIKALIVKEHEEKKQPLTQEKLDEMADLEAKRSVLKRLTSVQYKGNVCRSKFIDNFHKMMKMCNM